MGFVGIMVYYFYKSVTPSGVLFFGVTFFYNSCTPSGVTWIEIIDGVTWIEIIDGVTWNENNLWGNMEDIIGGITLYGMIDGK
jgi:hypothetical protein